MDVTESKLTQEVCRPAQETESTSNLAGDTASIKDGDPCRITWDDIEQALTEEWAIGGAAMATEPIRV